MTSTLPLGTDTRPDVAAFVDEVRALLADLPAEERDELVDGLEADLTEQVAEGAVDGLPDPASYAAELRAAAGLPSRGRSVRPALPHLADLVRLRERATRAARGTVGRHPLLGQASSMLVDLRPAWWVLRAWIAITLVDQFAGPRERVSLVPHLWVVGLGPGLLLVAVVISVLIGQGRLWPGARPQQRPAARLAASLVLLVLNVVALVAPLAFTFGSTDTAADPGFSYGYARAGADRPAGLSVKGRRVTNLFAYDLSGQPIEGVQLFDQDGRPVALAPDATIAGSGATRTVGCAWFNGTVAMLDVFPLQQQASHGQRCGVGRNGTNPIQAPAPPLAQVPPVTRTPTP